VPAFRHGPGRASRLLAFSFWWDAPRRARPHLRRLRLQCLHLLRRRRQHRSRSRRQCLRRHRRLQYGRCRRRPWRVSRSAIGTSSGCMQVVVWSRPTLTAPTRVPFQSHCWPFRCWRWSSTLMAPCVASWSSGIPPKPETRCSWPSTRFSVQRLLATSHTFPGPGSSAKSSSSATTAGSSPACWTCNRIGTRGMTAGELTSWRAVRNPAICSMFAGEM
jgi:hypothetical protein